MKTTKRHFRSEAGFTMIELVIAVIIIAILVAILIPILQERAAQAKYTAAKADLEMIAAAQERAAIDTGYMYRLFMLDDTGGPGDGANDPRVGVDSFADEWGRNAVHSVSAISFFIDPQTGRFIDDSNLSDTIFKSMETNYEALDITSRKWRGPYINWSRDGDILEDDTEGDDIPNDPWGNNYILITQWNSIYERTLTATSTSAESPPTTPEPRPADGDDRIQFGEREYPVIRFDRPTVVSFGPDGLPGDKDDRRLGMGDDLVRQW